MAADRPTDVSQSDSNKSEVATQQASPPQTASIVPPQSDGEISASPEQLIQFRKIRIVDAVTRNYRVTALLVFVGFCVWVMGDTIKAFAGKTTDFAAIVSLFTDSGASITISLSFTLNLFLGVWAIMERKLRLRKTEDLATRKAAAERLLDQKRTSSDLHPDGSTNPNDL